MSFLCDAIYPSSLGVVNFSVIGHVILLYPILVSFYASVNLSFRFDLLFLVSLADVTIIVVAVVVVIVAMTVVLVSVVVLLTYIGSIRGLT